MAHIRTKFRMPNFSGPLLTAVKQAAIEDLHRAATKYPPFKENYLNIRFIILSRYITIDFFRNLY
jgi:hypothetical protein